MSTEQITLNPDGTVYRGEKHIATVKDGVPKWRHHTFKSKYSATVDYLINGECESEPEDEKAPPMSDKFIPQPNENRTSHYTPVKEPAPAMDFRGDRTPGYPEWFLKQNGQEKYDEKYQVRGVNRYPEKEAADYPRANGSDTADKERNKPLN